MFKTDTKLFKIFFLIVVLFITILVLGRNTNPFSNEMFTFHDETQTARIQEFTYNLQQGNIPPRISPNFSFGLGYPMFNFYAPFPYWVASTLDLIGLDVITSLKLSFILILVTAFVGIFLLARTYTNYYAGILAAVVYAASPYIAVEIFVRGNLAELWFYALLPFALYLIKSNSKKRIILTTLVLSFLFTSHNVLSLVSVGIVIIFSLLTEKKWLNIISVLLGLLVSSYFLIPAITEIGWVYASEVAAKTIYSEHFLCIKQLWSSPWGFAGSAPGCDRDGMSFMIGKSNILLGIAGFAFWIYTIKQKKIDLNGKQIVLIGILMVGSLFMVTEYSGFIWSLTKPVSSLFQFPWRLLIFILFGFSFFSAFIANKIPKKFQIVTILILIIGVLYGNHEYFYGNALLKEKYTQEYLSKQYINNEVAYKVAEYLPRTASYQYWRTMEGKTNVVEESAVVNKKGLEILPVENTSFYKLFMSKSADSFININIHYAPYWQILVNNMPVTPESFDRLGRPVITVSAVDFDSISVQYMQTETEQIANLVSVVTLLGLVFFTVRQFKPKWKSMKIKKI